MEAQFKGSQKKQTGNWELDIYVVFSEGARVCNPFGESELISCAAVIYGRAHVAGA